MKKILTIFMTLILLVTSVCISGCNRDQGQSYDDKKSRLNVGVFDGGYGSAWAYAAKEDFEDFYAKTSFEEGKMGVEVVIDPKKDEFTATKLKSTVSSYQNTIYFLNQFNDFDGFYNSNLFVDITETLNEKVYDEDGYLAAQTGGEAVLSMQDIMYEQYKGKTEDGVYVDGYYEKNAKAYAAPWAYQCDGIIYDADFFDEEGYYFFADGTIGAKQADIDSGNCSTGPDMMMNTPDDGMPVYYSDFLTLLSTIKADSNIPFIWAGSGSNYQMYRAYESIWANYEGYDDYMLNFTLSGEDAQLGEINPTTYSSGILSKQEGIKAAIKTARDIVTGGNYYAKSFTTGYTDAQNLFIYSREESNRIAMLFECGYWEVEARKVFDEMGSLGSGLGFGERDFRRFPIPNFVDVEGITDQAITKEPETLIGHSAYKNLAFIAAENSCTNDYNVQLELAKLFLQFVNSREQLVSFTANTGGCVNTYHFTPNEEEMSTFTKFGRNIFEYINSGSKVALDVPLNKFRRDNIEDYEYTGHFYIDEQLGNVKKTFYSPFSFYSDDIAKNYTIDECWSYMQNQYKTLVKSYKG